MVGVEGGGDPEEEGCSLASLNQIKNELIPACGPLGFEFDCSVLRLRARKWTAPLHLPAKQSIVRADAEGKVASTRD